MNPIAILTAALGLLSGITSYRKANVAYDYSDSAANESLNYQTNSILENNDYWNRYIQKHHIDPRDVRYKYRSGITPNLSGVYSSQATLASNDYGRLQSSLGLAGSAVGSGSSMYSALKTPTKKYVKTLNGRR